MYSFFSKIFVLIFLKFGEKEVVMNQYWFQESLNQCLQNLALTDVDEQKKITQHYRGIERDMCKSNLKLAEYGNKQKIKTKREEIHICDNSVIQFVWNGFGQLESQNVLFGCWIESAQCYERQGSQEKFWQISLVEKRSGLEVISPLYDKKSLMSISRLRLTILGQYVTDDSKLQSIAWKWIQKKIVGNLEIAEAEKIPSAPGWYEKDGKWHFWTSADGDTLLTNDYIEKFHMKKYEKLTANEALEPLVNDINEYFDVKDGSVLLIYRLYALLGRLIGNSSNCPGIVLVGEPAELAAKMFLRTLENDVDTMNLDADSIVLVCKRVETLQETPAIFLLNYPDNKSTTNRLERVMSWMEAGYIEGTEIAVPFVFCLKKFSACFPLDGKVVLDVSSYKMWGAEYPYEKLQSFIISNIENSGDFWIKSLRRQYAKNLDDNDRKGVPIFKTIIYVVLEMFKDEVDDRVYQCLQNILHSGEEEIYRQLSSKIALLVELFREEVKELADSGKILVVERNKVPVNCEKILIYYDENCYYFTKNAFSLIAKHMEIDSRSMLSIRQQLIEQGVVKLYRKFMKGHRDFEIDFRICNAYGRREDLSGMAILCEFFDNIGGTKLYERSGEE